MIYEDFEPYTRLDWGGITYFFILASMRRFNKLYKNDFDILKTDSQKMMIILSPNGKAGLREYANGCSDEVYNKLLYDNTYKAIGQDLYPKLSISEAPLNITKDGYIFANPIVFLFSNSAETRYLSNLRKTDRSTYLIVKDKIKERTIPVIKEMVKYKIKDVVVITNFNVPIPNQGKQKRECDILLIDKCGFATYIEIKHFYNPISFSEVKSIDKELNLSLNKMVDQLNAISEGWEYLKNIYNFDIELREIRGVIGSHQYTGFDVPIDAEIPIVSHTGIFESIAESESVEDIYKGCKEFDILYPNIPLLNDNMVFEYANTKFEIDLEYLDPQYEIEFINSYKKQISDKTKVGERKIYSTITDLAEGYIKSMNE